MCAVIPGALAHSPYTGKRSPSGLFAAILTTSMSFSGRDSSWCWAHTLFQIGSQIQCGSRFQQHGKLLSWDRITGKYPTNRRQPSSRTAGSANPLPAPVRYRSIFSVSSICLVTGSLRNQVTSPLPQTPTIQRPHGPQNENHHSGIGCLIGSCRIPCGSSSTSACVASLLPQRNREARVPSMKNRRL